MSTTQASSSKGLPIVVLSLVVLAAAAVTWVLLSSDDATEDARPVAADQYAPGERMELPGGAPGEAELLTIPTADVAAAGAVSNPAAAALAEVEYARHDVQGRVVRADGEPLPDELFLAASTREPHPRVRRMSIARMLAGQEGFEPVPGVSNEQLVQGTRTPVETDGSFTLENAPDSGAWLAVESDELYLKSPVVLPESGEAGTESEELLVVLHPASTITGVLLDPEGAPVAGVDVEATTAINPYSVLSSSGMLLVETGTVETGEDGRFALVQIPPDIPLLVGTDGTDVFTPVTVEVPALAAGTSYEVEMSLLRGASVSGAVIDTEGAPIADARVELNPTRIDITNLDAMSKVKSDRVRTDAEGVFHFGPMGAGEYQIILAAKGYMPLTGPEIEVGPGDVIEDIVLVGDPGLSLAGQVVDEDGLPVPEARVLAALPPSLMSMQANIDRDRRSWSGVDEEGHFEVFGYAEGRLRIWAEAKGFVSTTVDASAGDDDVLVVLEPLTNVSGIAVFLMDGEPLEEYTLRLSPAGGFFDMANPMAIQERMISALPPEHVRDPEGRFLIEDVPPGSYDLTITADGCARTVLEGIEVLPGEGLTGLILLVPEEANAFGTVVSARTGAPIEGAIVTAGRTDILGTMTEAFTGGEAPKTLTDQEGAFTLGGLGTEPLTLTVQHDEHMELGVPEIVLQAGERRDLGELRLSDGATLWGHVLDGDGEPRADASVLVNDATASVFRQASSDADGVYRVKGLKPGTFNVMLMDFEFDTRADNPNSIIQDMVFESVTLEMDEVKRVDLGGIAKSGTRLEGVVRSKDGPEAGAMVFLIAEEGGMTMKFAASDNEGFYSVDGLQPGPYLVQVMPMSETQMGSGGQPAAPVQEMVRVGEGPVQRHDVHVPGATLRGEVRARRDRAPLTGIRVLLERLDEGRPSSRITEATGGRVGELYTGEDGTFRFEHLADGTYAVVAGGQNLMKLGTPGWAVTRVEDITVAEGKRSFPVQIVMDEGGAIAGTVRDSGGHPLGGIPVWARNDSTGQWLSLLSETTTGPSGDYSLSSLEPGPWTLVYGGTTHAYAMVRGISVRRGGSTDQDVVLEKGIEVRFDPSPYKLRDLAVTILGPQGDVPHYLSSVESLLGGAGLGAARRLGRFPAGTYDVTIRSGSDVLLEASETLVPGSGPKTVRLD